MPKNEVRQAQMFAIVEELHKSKVTREAFCELKGLSKNCFYYWQKKYRQQAGGDQPGFIPVRTGKGSSARSGFPQPIVLSYPNGISLQLPAGTPLSIIGLLLRLA
jgi:hypothetical protein